MHVHARVCPYLCACMHACAYMFVRVCVPMRVCLYIMDDSWVVGRLAIIKAGGRDTRILASTGSLMLGDQSEAVVSEARITLHLTSKLSHVNLAF